MIVDKPKKSTAATTPALPSVAGFTFTPGTKIAKIDKLMYEPDPQHWAELLALLLRVGSPCETAYLRCDDQGDTKGGYVNTQCQLGGSETYVKRTDPSKQSTSFSQANISFAARKNPLCNQATRDAHSYSYATKTVVIVDLAQGTASVGVNRSDNVTVTCSNCTYTKTLPPNANVADKCPQCKQKGTLSSG